jgi:hypothetical protein
VFVTFTCPLGIGAAQAAIRSAETHSNIHVRPDEETT